jgi:predicted MFS family arabinose efflux permease
MREQLAALRRPAVWAALLTTLLGYGVFTSYVYIAPQFTEVNGTFVFGAAAFAVVAPLQLRVMNAAGHAPDVASAANISAFTLGSALGTTSVAAPSTGAWG